MVTAVNQTPIAGVYIKTLEKIVAVFAALVLVPASIETVLDMDVLFPRKD